MWPYHQLEFFRLEILTAGFTVDIVIITITGGGDYGDVHGNLDLEFKGKDEERREEKEGKKPSSTNSSKY